MLKTIGFEPHNVHPLPNHLFQRGNGRNPSLITWTPIVVPSTLSGLSGRPSVTPALPISKLCYRLLCVLSCNDCPGTPQAIRIAGPNIREGSAVFPVHAPCDDLLRSHDTVLGPEFRPLEYVDRE